MHILLPKILFYLLTAVLVFLSTQTMARDAGQAGYGIVGSQIRYLIDEQHTWSIEDVLQDKIADSGWQQNAKQTPSFGFSPHTYWLHFQIPASPEEQIVELGYSLLDEVTFFLVKDKSVLQTVQTGDAQPFNQRPIQHRSFLFTVPPADQPYEGYLKIRSTSSIQTPLTLWPGKSFFEHDQKIFAEHGLYYGIVLVMSLYNFFLFLRLRDSAYALYVIYVLSFALDQMAISGFAYQFIWPDSPGWNERSISVLTPAVVVAGTLFVNNFLNLSQSYPNLFRISAFLSLAGVLVTILSIFLPYGTMIKFGVALAIITCLYIFIISHYVTIRSRHKYALYFSSAWSVFLLGVVMLSLNKFGIVPRTSLTESAAQIGSAIEIILLSFALAERLHDATVYRLKAEQEIRRVNKELIISQRKQNLRLEAEVATRTEELTFVLNKVKHLNDELQELSTVDQLTGARNRRYFNDLLDREYRRAKRDEKPLALLMIDLDHFKVVNDTHGHPAGDACLKAVVAVMKQVIKRAPDMVCRYGGEELAVILPETHANGAMLVAEKVREAISELRVESNGHTLQITASLGVYVGIPAQNPSIEDWVSSADKALYDAKHRGRNRVQLSPLSIG